MKLIWESFFEIKVHRRFALNPIKRYKKYIKKSVSKKAGAQFEVLLFILGAIQIRNTKIYSEIKEQKGTLYVLSYR